MSYNHPVVLQGGENTLGGKCVQQNVMLLLWKVI